MRKLLRVLALIPVIVVAQTTLHFSQIRLPAQEVLQIFTSQGWLRTNLIVANGELVAPKLKRVEYHITGDNPDTPMQTRIQLPQGFNGVYRNGLLQSTRDYTVSENTLTIVTYATDTIIIEYVE